ncbi:MAG: hypothetical protein KDJ74_04455 [Notoacmeibacter sp.]|nr:hypothetical protein [Notoacmeibacter sp.]
MKRAWLARAINGGIATGVILLDMMLAAMMFSAYAPSIGDYAFSGAVFAQLILVLMIAVHIKTKYERDVFTQVWLKRLSTIAILLMAIGVSSMIGFAFLDAAFMKGELSTDGGLQGYSGTEAVETQSNSSLTGWFHQLVAPFPPILIFLGLSGAMILTIYVASFFIGRALEAHRILENRPERPEGFWEHCERLRGLMKEQSLLWDAYRAQKKALPPDLEHAFARKAYRAVSDAVSAKRQAARRVFSAEWQMSPLRSQVKDNEAFPPDITTYEEAMAQARAILDGMRVHNILNNLDGSAANQGDHS